jgi:fatty acid desaturase
MQASGRRATEFLSPDEIAALTRASDLAGLCAVAGSWALVALALGALGRWPSTGMFVLVVAVLGGRQLALAVLMHEAAHGSLFRTRWLNEHVAQWLCAWPMWGDVARYRRHHLGHHSHAGTERDPDASLVRPFPTSGGALVRKFARDVLGASGLKRVLGLALMDLDLLEYTVAAEARRLPWRGLGHHLHAGARNAAGPLAANVALAVILAAAGAAWLYLAWVAAFLTSFGVVLRLRSIAEHACMEPTADPFRNTRTTRAGWLARALVAPHHVNYHLEHHLLMTVPYFRLPELHRLLAARGALPASSLASGYREVLRIAASGRPARAPS